MKLFNSHRLAFSLLGLAIATAATFSWTSRTLRADPLPGEAALASIIQNFHAVDSGKLYRGARPGTAGIQALGRAGVRTIIDLQGGDLNNPLLRGIVSWQEPGEKPAEIEAEHQDTLAAGMTFFSKPLDSLAAISDTEGHEIELALAIMHNPLNQPVFVHCEHGKDRTGLLIALYRVRYDGMTAQQAHDEMVANGHSGFLDHLVTGNMDRYFFAMAPRLAAEYKGQ